MRSSICLSVGLLVKLSGNCFRHLITSTIAYFDDYLSPLIGGHLSNPAKRYPGTFGTALWITHPYLLPCIVAAIFPAISTVLTVIFLREVKRTIIELSHNVHILHRPILTHGHLRCGIAVVKLGPILSLARSSHAPLLVNRSVLLSPHASSSPS